MIGTIFSFVTFSPSARATTLYVGGSGPGNYTTIQSAIDAAGWGATIYVYNGTYYENLNIGLPLKLIGEGRDVTTIDGQGAGNVIYVWDNNVTITGFTVTNAGTESGDSAIWLWGNRDCYISENTLSFGDQAGVAIMNSDHNIIVNNNVLLNRDYGIDIQASHGNVIANNTITHNVRPAIHMWMASRTTLTNNTMIEGGISLNGIDEPRDHWDTHTIDTLNTVNGKPVYYWKNLVGGTVPSDAGQVILVNTTDVVVKNMEMSNVSMAIILAFASNTTVINNAVYSNNDVGIYLYKSTDNTVATNTLIRNIQGMRIYRSSRNLIANNTAFSNRGDGIAVWASDNNTISGNKALSNGGAGILLLLLLDTRDNIVTSNTVFDNQDGVEIREGGYSRVFHNNILDNAQQAFDNRNTSQWDNSYPSGGNWWSDYAGEDNYSGPNQDIPGSDGIGDTPYVVDADSQDRYPLVAPVGPVGDTTPPEIGDVFINGKQSQTYALGDIPQLNLTAVVDDRFTGNSTIIEANYTYEPLNWSSSQSMQAADGVFDSSLEKALSVISPPNELGRYSYCVYAWDASANFNTTSVACAELNISTTPSEPFMVDAILNGPSLQDVVVSWNRSGDDGTGDNDVVQYDVYRSTSYDGTYLLVGNVTANGSSTYKWNCGGCGEGDPNGYFFLAEASDGSLSSPAPNRVAKFIRPLSQAPNLVSIPLVQSNENIETVLQTVKYDKAWFYDSSSQAWKWFMKSKTYRRGLWNMDHTDGMWANITGDCNLTVAGVVPAQTTIHLVKGWNLVSFPSFNSSYRVSDLMTETGATRVEGYDPGSPYRLRVLDPTDVLQAGQAYWVRVDANVDWIVEVS